MADKTKFTLYVWRESRTIPGRPVEYSDPPIALQSETLSAALDETKGFTAGKPKWELFEGSGWSGKAAVATGKSKINEHEPAIQDHP